MANYPTLEDQMLILDEAFSRTRLIMEGRPDIKFTPQDYQKFYGCVYSLCAHGPPGISKILYDRYKYGLQECVNSLVLPALEDKNDEILLAELVVQWNNYKVMVRWLSRFFSYLERFYTTRYYLPSLLDQANLCFHSLVNERFSSRFIAGFMSMINRDRNGDKCSRNLLKNVVEYFVKVRQSVGGTCYGYGDFQQALLSDASAYYSHIASDWLQYDSCADYMHKAQWCLNEEEERANYIFDPLLKDMLLQVARTYLVDQALGKLAAKQQAENYGISTDYQDLLSKCAGLNIGNPGMDPDWRMA